VPLGHAEPSLLPIPGYLNIEEVTRSLLLEPFTYVPLVNGTQARGWL
jgi:hypothetical protein